jgi:hypothetical protein
MDALFEFPLYLFIKVLLFLKGIFAVLGQGGFAFFFKLEAIIGELFILLLHLIDSGSQPSFRFELHLQLSFQLFFSLYHPREY